MQIRDVMNLVDLMELDLQGTPNMNINYQGRPVDNRAANLLQNPPNIPLTAPASGGQGSAAPAPTGDPTLNRPLPPRAPRDPNAPGLATRIGRGLGQVGKAVGAVASVPQGIGRAVKKGYQAGLQTIGGPGAGGSVGGSAGSAPRAGGSAGGGQGGANVNDEIADLRQMINRLDARVTALSGRPVNQPVPEQSSPSRRRLRVVR